MDISMNGDVRILFEMDQMTEEIEKVRYLLLNSVTPGDLNEVQRRIEETATAMKILTERLELTIEWLTRINGCCQSLDGIWKPVNLYKTTQD